MATYALPVLGRAYLDGQRGTLAVVEGIFDNPLRIIFVFAFVSYAIGFILFGVSIWRSGVLRRGAAISLGLHAPLVSSFVRPQPNPAVVLGALLFILGATLVALGVFREPSPGRPRGPSPVPTDPESKH